MGSFPFKYHINEEKLGRTRNRTQNSGKHRNPVSELFQCIKRTFNSSNTKVHTLQTRALYLGSFRGDPQLSICVFLEFFQLMSLKEHLGPKATLQNNILRLSRNAQNSHGTPKLTQIIQLIKLGHINSYWSAGCPQNSPRICTRTSDWT